MMMSLSEASWSTPFLETKRQRAPDWDTETSVAYKQLPSDGDRVDNRENERVAHRRLPESIKRLEDVVPTSEDDLVADRELKRAHPQHASKAAENPYGISLLRNYEQLPEHQEMKWNPTFEKVSTIGGVEAMQDQYRMDVGTHSSYLSNKRVERGGDNLSKVHIDPARTEKFGYHSRELPLPLRQRKFADPAPARQSRMDAGNALQKPMGQTSETGVLRRSTTRVEYAPIVTHQGLKQLHVGNDDGRARLRLRDTDTTRDNMTGKIWSQRRLDPEPSQPIVAAVPMGLNSASERQYFEVERSQQVGLQDQPTRRAKPAPLPADDVAVIKSRTSQARQSYVAQRGAQNPDVAAVPSYWTDHAGREAVNNARAARNVSIRAPALGYAIQPTRYEQAVLPSNEEAALRFDRKEVFLASSLEGPVVPAKTTNVPGQAFAPDRRQSEGYLHTPIEYKPVQPTVNKYLQPEQPDLVTSTETMPNAPVVGTDRFLSNSVEPNAFDMSQPVNLRQEFTLPPRAPISVAPSNLTNLNWSTEKSEGQQRTDHVYTNVRRPPSFVSLMAPTMTNLYENPRTEVDN